MQLNTLIVNLAKENGSNWYKKFMKMGARPGEENKYSFDLPKHLENNLSPLQAANEIGKYFSKISQEYPPIDVKNLPNIVQEKISETSDEKILLEHEVYQRIKKQKKTNSMVPGDIPKKILLEFIPELSTPITAIFNKILSTNTYPEQWVKEYHTPIPKVPIPESEDQLRNIALTSFFSKTFETFILEWLWPYISPHLDPGQFGGIPGSSITHYIIKMINFILSNTDNNSVPKAVLAALVDFSKAFNRMNHHTLIEILFRYNVPGWLLKLIIAYLTKRKMVVRYKGVTTEEQDMPGGSPQGTLLGMFLFILQVNDAGKTPEEISNSESEPPKDEEREKYVDDLTLMEAIDLKKSLCSRIDKS